MPSAALDRELIIAVTPCRRPDGRLVVGVCRGGGLGVLDLGADRDRAERELALVVDRFPGNFGVRIEGATSVTLPERARTVILAAPADVAQHTRSGRQVIVEVTSRAEAEAAVAAGAAGLVAKGSESGGRVGDETAFVLLQRLVEHVEVPIWLQGGIGLHTAAAAVVGGARGVVLDIQLALARESILPGPIRSAIAAMDGSETDVVGGHRVFIRADLRQQLLPIGQDGALASGLARQHVTAGGIVQAVRASIDQHIAAARTLQPLAPGNGIAAARGTTYPIAQGPMTRVSDRASFAAAVADGGGLPFLALSLMSGSEIRDLLADTRDRLAGRPWGVGILGFVPPELREEQLAVVRQLGPPVALIAGGRPSQAAPLEAEGIATYLHVPSPGLLDRFLEAGARRFVFEGRECGGHVGPRSSFALWELQIERLLAQSDLSAIEVLFAGGIHDSRSAAMVAALAAVLAERGAQLGVLMGTAYVLTAEAVESGAITPVFQRAALECQETVLLETSPGHATRCVDSAYVAAFETRKQELTAQGVASRDMWAELETLNLGRLRIAAKGLVRDGDTLAAVDAEEQRHSGMFMIGQVAGLRNRPTTIVELHTTVSEGSAALLDRVAAETVATPHRGEVAAPLDIAVIGMAGLFPGATSVDRFWANVVAGVDAVTEVPPERWSIERYYDPEATNVAPPDKTPSKWGGFVPAVAFDPTRYGIPPRSISSIGPDQLLSLEVAAAALADAGYGERAFDRDRTAVVFGAEAGTDLAAAYAFRSALAHFAGSIPAPLATTLPVMTEDSFPGVLANVIAGRIANRLDLGGANYTVDAACGASMAALAAACKELTTRAADMVLCGGADLHNGIYDYLLFSATHALSPHGRCRTFDTAADGIALGEAIGCVVLKRLTDAERDGDRVLAVIDAVASSSDGRSLGLTAPRRTGQRRALERAYDAAGVSPASVGLVEAHGTGTVVGDRTELTALTEIYTERGAAPSSCTLGSVKSQIGHTKCAAGIAGLIKAVHAVHRGVLPPTLHLQRPNGAYDPKTSPFVFNDRARPWVADDRRAAVSAFGFGGSNFHAVLSSYSAGDPPAHGLDQWPAELFLVRGQDDEQVTAALDQIIALLDANDAAGRPWRLRDLARTVHERGADAPVQRAFVAADLDDLRCKLDDASPIPPADGQVAFLYPGQGSQRLHMLADLFVAFPALRRHLQLAGSELAERIFPPQGFDDTRAAQLAELTDTRVAQPALAVVELALTDLLGQCGVRADHVAGHSFGELTALAVAGAIEPASLLELSRARGEAIMAVAGDDPGTMAAVRASAVDVAAALAGLDVCVANDNAPDQCVISGPTSAVDAAVAQLARAGFASRRVKVACAFHTPTLVGATELFQQHLAEVPVAAPQLPLWSNRSAGRYPDDDAGALREQLAAQLSSPVAFRAQIEAMYAAGVSVFVEAGPGRVLSRFVDRILGDRPHRAIPCDVAGEDGITRFLLALAELALAGVPVDVTVLYEGRDARTIDATTTPPRPAFLLDGHLVRDRDGNVVPGSLPPATEFPSLHLNGARPARIQDGGDVHATVTEYLQGLQQIVAAERDVMLTLLGAARSGSAAIDVGQSPGPSAALPAISRESLAAPSATPASAPAPVAAGTLLETIVAIVSERTGYPAEMLDPDLDLEAELSIDSIKRIEILAELADRVGLPGMDEAGAQDDIIEELALAKSLRSIVEWIEDRQHGTSRETSVGRYVPTLVPAPSSGATGSSLAGRRVGIVGDSAIAAELRTALEGVGATVTTEGFDLLVDVGALDGNEVGEQFERLRDAALHGEAEVVVVTGSAFRGVPMDSGVIRAGAAAAGMVRTLRQELPTSRARVIDVDPGDEPSLAAGHLVAELTGDDPASEVVYRDGTRHTVSVVSRAVDVGGGGAGPVLTPDSVVLVTGGARGIASRLAVGLARRFGCRLELVGRSPLASPDEPADLATAQDAAAIRQAILARGQTTQVREVEAECARVLAAREIRGTLRQLEGIAADVVYHPVDVRDPVAVAALLADVRQRRGRLDGVIHAAGINQDKLLRDKTVESFTQVFDTKVGAAELLADAPDPDGFVLFFASVSGLFGNVGQVDYAAANCVLDALARHRAAAGLGPRIAAIDWGPWAETGMVTPELAREYERRGVGLISPDAGVACALAELAHGLPDPQVALMCANPEDLARR